MTPPEPARASDLLNGEAPTLAVFTPSPILTVTVEKGGVEPEIHFHPGGQGAWVARMAATLGARVTLCAPLGGESGAVLRALLPAERIRLIPVQTARPNGAYVHDRTSGERRPVAEVSSPRLTRHEADELFGAALTAGLEAGTALLTGPQNDWVTPNGFYARLARDLRGNGARVLADLTGPALRDALAGGLGLLKLSSEEAVASGYAASEADGAVHSALRALHDAGADHVLISRAERPAVALVDGEQVEVVGPSFEALEPHGAGDSMFAALGVALAQDATVQDALRVAVAAGALNVTRRGLGTGHLAEIERLVQLVQLHPQAET